MPLLTLRQIQLAFGGAPLLDHLDLAIEPRERICLIGRNGSGKSTLLQIISGDLKADDGVRVQQQNLVIARLTQQVPENETGTVFEVISSGLGHLGELIRAYHDAIHALETATDDAAMNRLSRTQHELEAADGWQTEQRVESVISRLSLNPDVLFADLSGGLKRRVMLGRALVRKPDLLLLDEPTNHLDIASIDWLEEFLRGYDASLLFITHDRMFLRKLATRIIELDRGQLTDWPGDYDNFLRRKDEMLHAEEVTNARFDKKLAEEEVWIRQGIKARRTRNEGRVRALETMRAERMARRNKVGKGAMQMQDSERSGKLVVETDKIGFAWDNSAPTITGFTTTIMRGDKIGLMGPNGCGKTTLLNLLLGKLQPQQGTIRLGMNLEIAYFDQLRDTLDPEMTVRDAVADGSDKVEINGSSRHVISYLRDFLFSPDQVGQPIKSLSGGELGRLLLARLFTKPFNLLVMDEPTNDLDSETLDLLEERLLDYKGTLLLVSHDRAFLNNVVTSTMVFEGDGRISEYVGGYDDWLRQRDVPSTPATKTATSVISSRKLATSTTQPPKQQPKLSYKDQQELDALPAKIATLEEQIEAFQQQMIEPDFYQREPARVNKIQVDLADAESALAKAYERWEMLEDNE